ncbi:translesion error-prone DNA polymerase V subunit UmuC [Lelliottia aquatilis]|uniref:translesion error-prone DNA polymerase V subunit UmuC n=2 Tax=Lelliottia TaxID=1330545 RepID=UPI00192C22F3|nr:translesion error-prone DNA polymerase V subunit UmuC [Lelliottia amnigena]MBL5885584.1 translesion error-prone DNA polymerase V subunit UmuC [Lelliottia aquatilis]MBL5932072.1 translesion error-prone DNA polymerase V subunit UmuC [Lelliottia amnigena]
MYMHVDINGAYAAFETAMEPKLADHPLLILSNNDSMVIAMNQKAKNIGIKRGAPLFKCQELIKKHRIAIRSSNFTLYEDYSNRFHETLEGYAAATNRYSVDECFMSLAGMTHLIDPERYGREIRATLQHNLSLTCGVGVGISKTLAKLATYASKRWKATGGVVVLTDPIRIQKLLSLVETREIWGIGKRISEHLCELGIKTGAQFANTDVRFIRKTFGVQMERTWRELNGEPCFALDDSPPARQQIIVSRSFGQRLTERHDLHEAVSFFTARAAEQLRLDGSWARQIMVFIQSSHFAKGPDRFSTSGIEFLTSTQDTRDLNSAAIAILNRIYRPGVAYAKAGVVLSSMTDGTEQLSLFDERPVRSGSEALMKVMDRLNRQHRGTVFMLAEGIEQPFRMKQTLLSPRYTTRWDELPVARS